MRIKEIKSLNIEVILDWEDFENLDKGKSIESRYNGWHKLYVHPIFPCDPYDRTSKLESLKQREYAELDRRTMDIHVYIPHGVLVSTWISASNFKSESDNFKISPESHGEPWDSAHIRVLYPGSLKVIDLPACWESIVEAQA